MRTGCTGLSDGFLSYFLEKREGKCYSIVAADGHSGCLPGCQEAEMT